MTANANQREHSIGRRDLLAAATAAAAAAVLPANPMAAAEARPSPGAGPRAGNPIAVSTYSFWRFLENAKLKIENCTAQRRKWVSTPSKSWRCRWTARTVAICRT